MILGLRSVTYPVSDLAAAKTWYSKVLGKKPHVSQAAYVGFPMGSFELGLVPSKEPSTGGQQAFWNVDDIDSVYQQLIDLGAEPIFPVSNVGGGTKVGIVRDPFGNSFGIVKGTRF